MRTTTHFEAHRWSRRLIGAALAIVLLHVVTTSFGTHRDLWSNTCQLLMSMFAALVCAREWHAAASGSGKRDWFYVALAFALWSLAQCVYLHDMYYPALRVEGRSVDDALWLLVGLPLLVTVCPTIHDGDVVRWLDKLQILIIFAVLYLLVFQAHQELSVQSAYTLQNILLALCCLVKLSAETADRERRFYIRLAIFLGAYAGLGAIADLLISKGIPTGTPLDIVWTLPFALFCVLLLWRPSGTRERSHTSPGHARSVGRLHSLSIGMLPVISIGAAVHLTHVSSRLGLCFFAVSVFLFLFRVAKRESNWQSTHHNLESALLTDSLTGLGNRVLLRRVLQDAMRLNSSADKLVLIFADMDQFKSVNDTLGHEQGDALLVQVGQRLHAASPHGATVCRLGGDEFIVLTKARDAAAAESIGQLLLEAIRTPFALGRHTVRCTASVGVVFGDDGESADELLRTADHAMYQAKQSGRNRVTLFEEEWRASVTAHWQIEADLRLAIQNNGIQVVFQPIVDLNSATIQGFEALARWSHPLRGPVAPTVFITMAEEMGLIGDLGLQVLLKACTQIVEWNRLWDRSFVISVNLSPKQVADPNLVIDVASILERTGADPRCLKLEITESALLVGMAGVKRALGQLRGLGVLISLDDFGTGYSSLSFLLNLPVDEIKVDRSFVSNMERGSEKETIVQKVIQLGHGLDKMIVAEGAETMEDVQNLISMNCEQVQGWFFCRPQGAVWIEKHFHELNLQVRDSIAQIRSQRGFVNEADELLSISLN